MIAKLVDHKVSKIILGVIAVPVAAMVISGFTFGGALLLFYFKDIEGFAIGLVSLFSVVGVLGALLRISNTNQSLSKSKRISAIAMMVVGEISTVISAIYTYKEAFPLLTPVLLVLASLLGIVLILSTIEEA